MVIKMEIKDDNEISKFNVRKNLDKEELEILAESLKEHGLLQPILIKLNGKNRFQLIAGQRRLEARKKINKSN